MSMIDAPQADQLGRSWGERGPIWDFQATRRRLHDRPDSASATRIFRGRNGRPTPPCGPNSDDQSDVEACERRMGPNPNRRIAFPRSFSRSARARNQPGPLERLLTRTDDWAPQSVTARRAAAKDHTRERPF